MEWNLQKHWLTMLYTCNWHNILNQLSVLQRQGEVGGRFRREGTYVHRQLIHVDVWQKPTQYCKAIILQIKINTLEKMTKTCEAVIPRGRQGGGGCKGDGGLGWLRRRMRDRGGQPTWVPWRAACVWGARAHVHSVCGQRKTQPWDWTTLMRKKGERCGSDLGEDARGVLRLAEITREREKPQQHAPEHTSL